MFKGMGKKKKELYKVVVLHVLVYMRFGEIKLVKSLRLTTC